MTKSLYMVTGVAHGMLYLYASSSDQAKRLYCKMFDMSPSSEWRGVRSLGAKKLKPAEVRAWEVAQRDRALRAEAVGNAITQICDELRAGHLQKGDAKELMERFDRLYANCAPQGVPS